MGLAALGFDQKLLCAAGGIITVSFAKEVVR